MNHHLPSKLLRIAAVFFVAMIAITACEYETIEIDELDPDEVLSFSGDIIPIFEKSCTSCHRPGSTSPDLTADNAYNSIVPNLIDLENPENSTIYNTPNPSSGGHAFQKYTQAEAAQVLQWIKQGAENN